MSKALCILFVIAELLISELCKHMHMTGQLLLHFSLVSVEKYTRHYKAVIS